MAPESAHLAVGKNNLAIGIEFAKLLQLSVDGCTRAVEAAERALSAWAKLRAKQRSNILRKWYELIIANREDLALILTSKQGKPLSESLGEVDIGGAYVEFYTEEARRIYGETIPSPSPDARLLAIKATGPEPCVSVVCWSARLDRNAGRMMCPTAPRMSFSCWLNARRRH